METEKKDYSFRESLFIMRTGFVAFLFLVFAFALATGRDWPAGAGVYVIVIASFGLVLTATDLLLTTVLRYGRRQGAPVPINLQEIVFFLYIIAYALAAYLFGAVLASVVFMFTFLKFYTKSKWFLSVAGAAAMSGFLWIVDNFLGLSLLEGLIRF